MSEPWVHFPFEQVAFLYDDEALRQQWPRLHAGDAEPWPRKPALVDGWRLFHAGRFQAAHVTGLVATEAGNHSGMALANKAQACQARYLERDPGRRQAMYLAVAERATRHQALDPEDPNAYYWQAYALGWHAQAIGMAKGLGRGFRMRFMRALETTFELAPLHADAHLALGVFHAEVLGKFGRLVGRTLGAEAAKGIDELQRAAALDPANPMAMIERARALLILDGDTQRADALYVDAASAEPLDALEFLGVELARDALDE